MSVYTLDHIIQECLQEKMNVLNTGRGKTPGAKIEIYANSWVSLNAWIESRLARRKGASIGGFGSFCWEIVAEDDDSNCRPIFIISDTFVKVYHVKKQRIHKIPQLTQTEEVNYSLLAIKFSKSLTKDMVFNGIRDIVRKIGDFIMRGYELQVDFTFGSLYAKENKVKFTFNSQRLLEILPENLGIPEAKYTEQLTDRSGIEENNNNYALLSDRRITSAPSHASKNNNTLSSTPSLPLISKSHLPPETIKLPLLDTTFAENTLANNNNTLKLDTTSLSSSQAFDATATSKPSPIDITSDIKDIINALDNKALKVNKDEWRRQAKDRVMAQAFERYLNEIEDSAKFDDTKRYEAWKGFEDWRDEQNKKKENVQQSYQNLKMTLKTQMSENELKMAKERDEQKNTMIHYIFDETHCDVTPTKNTKLAKELVTQIKQNEETRAKQLKETKMKEKDYIDRLNLEVQLDKLSKRAGHLEKQRELLESWERDGHVRTLKKLSSQGTDIVKQYIDRNLNDPVLTPSFSQTMSGSLNMSIGYDPRKGKI